MGEGSGWAVAAQTHPPVEMIVRRHPGRRLVPYLVLPYRYRLTTSVGALHGGVRLLTDARFRMVHVRG